MMIVCDLCGKPIKESEGYVIEVCEECSIVFEDELYDIEDYYLD